jgi:hypothetical protein
MKPRKSKAVQLGLLLLLIGALAAQFTIAQGSSHSQVSVDDRTDSGNGAAESDVDGDGVLDCAPGVLIHGSAGFIGIGDPSPTKTGALTNYLSDEKSAEDIPLVASDFDQHSVGEGGGVLWVSRDRQVLAVMEQDAKGEWYVVARAACSDVFDEAAQ